MERGGGSDGFLLTLDRRSGNFYGATSPARIFDPASSLFKKGNIIYYEASSSIETYSIKTRWPAQAISLLPRIKPKKDDVAIMTRMMLAHQKTWSMLLLRPFQRLALLLTWSRDRIDIALLCASFCSFLSSEF